MGGDRAQREAGDAAADPVVVRRSEQGWQVGPEETADLTSAMVLADLLAADLGSPVPPPAGPTDEADEPPPRKRGRSPRYRMEEHARTGENVAAER